MIYSLVASAEVDRNLMDPVYVEDNKILVSAMAGQANLAGSMAKLNSQAHSGQTDPTEETTGPLLYIDGKRDGQEGVPTTMRSYGTHLHDVKGQQ